MPHPARHSRPKARQQIDQHALGSLLEEIGSRAPAAHRLRKEHAEQRAEHAQQQQHPETTAPRMSLRQDGAHASASPQAIATWRELMLRARDATDPPVAMRPLDARATCCGRTSDVLHEAYGTGTALGGGLLRDAATCRGSSSHIHVACVGLKAEDEETGTQAPASACTAAQPHPPPGPPPTILLETVEDPKRALVHALQNDLSRMSVLLERLDELLIA